MSEEEDQDEIQAGTHNEFIILAKVQLANTPYGYKEEFKTPLDLAKHRFKKIFGVYATEIAKTSSTFITEMCKLVSDSDLYKPNGIDRINLIDYGYEYSCINGRYVQVDIRTKRPVDDGYYEEDDNDHYNEEGEPQDEDGGF